MAPAGRRAQGSDRMQDAVSFEDSKRLDKRHAGMEQPPFPRVPHPVDIETVVPCGRAGERRIELLAAIVFHARSVALHKTISPRRPRAVDVDHVVPFRRPNLRQEARFQDVVNEASQAAMIARFSASRPAAPDWAREIVGITVCFRSPLDLRKPILNLVHVLGGVCSAKSAA